MDNYREVELLPAKGVGASGTETIDIAIDEPLTALYVYFYGINGAATADEVPPERCIDKIEIVDGGQVYWSTDGPEAVAAAVYETGKWPAHWYQETKDLDFHIHIPLLFGRYLGDEEFAFSPSRLLNPQLKVTWTRNALHTATGYQLGVRAKAMQGVSAPSKALMVRNIRTYTATIAGIEPTDLPIDLDYRKLYVHAYAQRGYWQGVVTHFKLDCDVGKLIAFDMSAATLLAMIMENFPQVEVSHNMCLDDGVMKDTWLGTNLDAAVNSGNPDVFVNAWAQSHGAVWQWSANNDGASQNDEGVNARFFGFCPHHVMAYEFGRSQDPASWFKASQYGQVRLQMTGGTVGGSASILLQRPTVLP